MPRDARNRGRVEAVPTALASLLACCLLAWGCAPHATMPEGDAGRDLSVPSADLTPAGRLYN